MKIYVRLGEKIPTTEEQLSEYLKCSQDILYFANHYFTIQTGTGYSIIKLREYQERILKALVEPEIDKPNAIILSARQIGKCICYDSYITVRKKNSKEKIKIKIGDFYEMINKNSKLKK